MADVFQTIGKKWVLEQHPKEIHSFAWYLREHYVGGPVIELGVRHGGTSALWHQLIPEARVVIGVDRIGADSYQEPEFSDRAREMEAEFPRFRFVAGDTGDPKTVEVVRALLADDPAGFLFIDADHAYESVKRDYEWYRPLVRPGGMIAFHDIVDSPKTGGGVTKFWREIGGTVEFKIKDGDWGGIGAVRV